MAWVDGTDQVLVDQPGGELHGRPGHLHPRVLRARQGLPDRAARSTCALHLSRFDLSTASRSTRRPSCRSRSTRSSSRTAASSSRSPTARSRSARSNRDPRAGAGCRSAPRTRAQALGRRPAQDRVAEHEVREPDAEVGHDDAAAPGAASRRGRLAERRARIRVAVELAGVAVGQELLALVDEEQGRVAGDVGGAVRRVVDRRRRARRGPASRRS